MMSPAETPENRADLTAFRAVLVQHFRSCGEVTEIEIRQSAYQSSFPLREVDLRFDDGTRLTLIAKCLCPDALPDELRTTKPAFLIDPAREPIVYESVLATHGVTTAAYFETVNDADHRPWLLLERVPGLPLVEVGSLEIWKSVSRWLAEIHFRMIDAWKRISPPARNHLINYDEAYFHTWVDRAIEVQSRSGNRKAAQWLTSLRPSYPAIVRAMTTGPQTLIHGEFYASNVLVVPLGGDLRVCPIDWEMAGQGPALIDLAALVAGNWPFEQQSALIEAYQRSWQDQTGQSSEAPTSFARRLACCQLHIAVQWLGWSADWSPPKSQDHDWLAQARQAARKLS